MELNRVSIIIVTRNEASHIENCLKSINAQVYPLGKIEIIVVDNYSEDETVLIARKYTNNVYLAGPERSAQRNYGVKKAKGEYVLYLDADMTLSEKVISECVDKSNNEGLIAIYIPERIVDDGFWNRVRDYERSFYTSTIIDSARFVRRDKFEEACGFDEGLFVGEDWDFDRRIKKLGKIGTIEAPLYHDEKQFTLKKYIGKKSYYAGHFYKYVQKWGRDDAIVKKQLGFRYRYFGVFCESGKWKRLFRHPVFALHMYFLRFLIGFCYILKRK